MPMRKYFSDKDLQTLSVSNKESQIFFNSFTYNNSYHMSIFLKDINKKYKVPLIYPAICNIATLFKFILATVNIISQRLQFTDKILIFDGPSWTSIDKNIFKDYQSATTLIIKNTSISEFPKGSDDLKYLHTIECINNLNLIKWSSLFMKSKNQKKSIRKLVLDENKKQYVSIKLTDFTNLNELTICNSICLNPYDIVRILLSKLDTVRVDSYLFNCSNMGIIL